MTRAFAKARARRAFADARARANRARPSLLFLSF